MTTRVKQDKPQWESALFQPVLKAYPWRHSWIITAHVSIGDLSKQLQMFNHQKALAQDLLIKLQQQPFTSNFVYTLLGEFSNIANIYHLYEPIIWTAVVLLRNEPVMDKSMASDNLWPKKKSFTFLGKCTSLANRNGNYKGYIRNNATSQLILIQLIQKQTQQQESLVYVISILNITRYATQEKRKKINEVMDALQKANLHHLRYHHIYNYAHTIFAYLRDCITYMK